MDYREFLMSAYKMEEFIILMILLRFMNKVRCEKLNKFYEKYLVDNQKVDEIFFGELSNIKNKKYLTPLELLAIPSAILVFYAFPRLPVIDRHNWFALYDERVESFYVNDYKKFLYDATKIAKECDLTPRTVDCSLYQMGREKITLHQE